MKALIDSGTCSSTSVTSNCGDSATGYYETFEYNGQRVIIVSGAPNHAAESELFISSGFFNPNSRCKLNKKGIHVMTHFIYTYLRSVE